MSTMRQVGTFYGNGIDKLRISKRIDWVKDNHDKIVKTVENWKTDRFWLEADEPCQFLQNCKEYIDAVNSAILIHLKATLLFGMMHLTLGYNIIQWKGRPCRC